MKRGPHSVSTRPILVHMPEALIERLDEIAVRHGISRSELIRLTLKLHQDIEPLQVEVRWGPESSEDMPTEGRLLPEI